MEKIVWEDRQIVFDIPNIQNKLRGGENILDILDYIEDTKGNPNDHGRLLITNLRIIWFSLTHTKFNLSIGYFSIITMTTKTVISKLRGTTQALYILASSNNSRFEFIFTNMAINNNNNTTQFSSIFEIYRIYQSTFLYRELKLRSAIFSSKQLKILEQEQVYSTLNGIWNLSSDQGNLGTFIITNIRIIWYADINDSFNISLPYIQIGNIKIRQSKYGLALVIYTLSTGGGYVLGFRVDPPERLQQVYKELNSLFAIYSVTPILGVFYEPKKELFNNPQQNELIVDEINEIDDSKTNKEINTNFSAYLAECSHSTDKTEERDSIYCKELGFAMEKIADGFTLKDLWEIIPSK